MTFHGMWEKENFRGVMSRTNINVTGIFKRDCFLYQSQLPMRIKGAHWAG